MTESFCSGGSEVEQADPYSILLFFLFLLYYLFGPVGALKIRLDQMP